VCPDVYAYGPAARCRPAGGSKTGVFMRNRFVLGAVATATIAGVLPAGAARAQLRAATPQATAAARQVSLPAVHLVTGVVQDASGHAVRGACVLAVGAAGQATIARTGANGRYELALAKAGAYSLRYRDCQPGRGATVAAPDRQVIIGASPMTSLPATVLARPAAASRQEAMAAAGVVAPQRRRIVVAQPGQVIENGRARRLAAGTQKVAVMTGRATSPSGRPLAGICMWIVGKDFAAGSVTGKNGAYRLEISGGGFANGRFPVEFDSSCEDANPFVPIAPGPWAPEWYKGKFSQARATRVPFRTGKTTRGINAVMRPGGEVSGTVTGSDHRRLRNACAVLEGSSGQEFGQALTNARGAYTITGLDAGTYRLLGVAGCPGGTSDYGQAWYPRAATIKNAQAVTVRLGHRTTGIDVVVPKLGTISGQVRLGGKRGRPLAGICVDAFSPTNPDLTGGSTATNRDGKYTMEGIAPGRYEVDASAGGCGNKGDYAPGDYPRLVRVSDARTTGGVNVYLQPGGILSGTVTAGGVPLAGICVDDDNGDFAVTASNGTYKIDELPAERVSVSFSGGCGNSGSYAPQYFDGQTVPELARTVVITAGHTTGGIGAAMLPGATIAGTVTNAAGHAVRGVCVSLGSEAAAASAGPIGGDTTTAANGSYSVANLAPGQYAVAFFAGCQGPSNAAAMQWFKGQPGSGTPGLVSVQAGPPVTGVNAVVARGGTIKGTVTSNGSPVDFDCVYAVSLLTGAEAGFQANMGSGQFAISGLPAGRYRVVAYDCLEGNNSAPAAAPRTVTVRAGHTTGGVHIALPRGGSITGRVTIAASGRPAQDVCVSAVSAGRGAAADLPGGFAGTGRSGTYRITGLNTGRYVISLYTLGYCHKGSQNLAGRTLKGSVRVTAGTVTAKVNASLGQGGSISGRVTGPGGKDVAGACVELFQLPGGLIEETETGAYGAYALSGLAGRFKVELGDPGCSDGAAGLAGQWYDGAGGSGSATIVTVRAGKTTASVGASLLADGGISGSVTGPAPGHAALTGICVSAVPAATGQSPVYTVSAAGSYQLPDLLPGKYRVEFQSGCGQAGLATQWWDLASSSQAALVVDVGSGDTVTGINGSLTSG
jgi:hypothetical protein